MSALWTKATVLPCTIWYMVAVKDGDMVASVQSGATMDIQCPQCKSSNTFNPDEITQSGKNVICNNCKAPFLIRQVKVIPQFGIDRDKVMVANANPHFCSAIKDFLSGHGLEVVIAKDGVEALQSLEIDIPNVALVDVALPGMYGFEICDFIRTNEKLKGIKIILLASIYDKTRYKRMPTSIYGADDYIEMHHIPDELIPKINSLLGRDRDFVRAPIQMRTAEFEAVIMEETLSQKIKEITAQDIKIQVSADKELDKVYEEAKRLARIIASDIILYNQEAVEDGIRKGNLYDLLKDDIKEGVAYYANRVSPEIGKNTSYLRDAFEELIAKMKKERGI